MKRLTLTLALGALLSCVSTTDQRVEHLATAQVASDFPTYAIRRVGILPPVGRGFDVRQSTALQGILFTEFSQEAPYEFVPLHEWDLEEVDLNESYVRGRYEPAMVIDLARRFDFDAMLVATVVDAKTHEGLGAASSEGVTPIHLATAAGADGGLSKKFRNSSDRGDSGL